MLAFSAKVCRVPGNGQQLYLALLVAWNPAASSGKQLADRLSSSTSDYQTLSTSDCRRCFRMFTILGRLYRKVDF